MDIQPRLFEDDAKSRLGHIEARCRRCVEKAERDWNKACAAVPRMRKAARGRGRNSLFNELVADYAREEFGESADVDVCEQYGTVRLHIDGEYDLGFKKVDAKGRHCGYPTKRRLRYNAQLCLFDDPLPDAVRLHIGYQWNNAGTEIIDVYLIYPYRRTPLWMYPLGDDDSAFGGVTLTLPQPKTPPKPATFRSKKAKEGKAKGKAR